MADRFGTYESAFYMSGSVVMLAAAIPFVLLFIRRKESDFGGEKGQESRHKHPKRLIVNNNVCDSYSTNNDNMAANVSLDGSSNVVQTIVDGVVNESFTANDEGFPSSDWYPQRNCSRVELHVNAQLSSTLTNNNKNETTEELECDTRM